MTKYNVTIAQYPERKYEDTPSVFRAETKVRFLSAVGYGDSRDEALSELASEIKDREDFLASMDRIAAIQESATTTTEELEIEL